jgi:hypothetical protein
LFVVSEERVLVGWCLREADFPEDDVVMSARVGCVEPAAHPGRGVLDHWSVGAGFVRHSSELCGARRSIGCREANRKLVLIICENGEGECVRPADGIEGS